MPDAPERSQKIIEKLVKIWPYEGNQVQKRKDVTSVCIDHRYLDPVPNAPAHAVLPRRKGDQEDPGPASRYPEQSA